MRVFGTGESVWNGVFFENRQDCGLEDEEGTHVIVTLFETGSGTTAAAMMYFILAMTHHPE